MPKRVTGLTAVQVRKAKPGRYADGNGLYLLVQATGTRSWIMRYRLAERDREMGLGGASGRGSVTLAQARAAAQQHRLMIRAGVDPLDSKRAATETARAAAAVAKRQAVTFRMMAEQYIDQHEAKWRNAKHRAQWSSTLDAHAMPAFGDKSVAAVDTDDVMKALEPIWAKTPETATRLRGRIESVLGYATAKGLRSGENPARWNGHLATLLGSNLKPQQVVHHAALPWRQIGAFMAALRLERSHAARALEWTILTAARTAETIGATWSEVDLAAKLWTVPGARMKAGREHWVPLSDAALAVLKGVASGDDDPDAYVFEGRNGKPMSNMAMSMLLRRMGRPELTVHGFRSTFRDWVGEQTDTPREIAEACLAHVVGDKSERAYRRETAIEKRRAVMEAWAAFCAA